MPTPLELSKTRFDARVIVLETSLNALQAEVAALAVSGNYNRDALLSDICNQTADAIDDLNIRVTRVTADIPF